MGKRRIQVDDLLRFAMPSDPQISPDGTRAVFGLHRLDLESNGFASVLWMVSLSGGDAKQFTAGAKRDHSPRWSPDGRWVAFLSNRSGKDQIWLIPADGGEARQITHLRDGVKDLSWAPDSRRLCFLSRSRPDEREEEQAKPDPVVVRRYTRMAYKFDGVGLFDEDRPPQIHTVDVVTGEVVRITDDPYPVQFPVWSVDGEEILFVGTREDRWDDTYVRDVYAMRPRDGRLRCLTRSRGPVQAPTPSPDGRWVAYAGHDDRSGHATNVRVWVVPFEGGESVDLTDAMDRSVGGYMGSDVRVAPMVLPIRWNPEGTHVYFVAGDHGNAHLYAVDVATRRVQRVTTRAVEAVSCFDVGPLGRVVYQAMDAVTPEEIWLHEATTDKPLTDFNGALTGELDLGEVEVFQYAGADDWPIDAWLYKPPDFVEGRKYPLILQIHGGPHSAYGNIFSHGTFLLAAAGYLVLRTNPRGSQGYGEAFARAVIEDWGGRDFQDLMRGVDAVIQRGYVDTARMGVTGGSYGGFMTNWVISHTDRFRAAVTEVCICNLLSFYGTSDIGYLFGERQLGGRPWTNPQRLWEFSPLKYVERVATPVLIIGNEEDHRCPIEQSEQWFIALRKLGRDAEFVRYPGEAHTMQSNGRPKPRIDRLRRLLAWWGRHLGGDAAAVERPLAQAEAAE
ncbi:MAG: S9 family peptidase [Armatimonadota bacterium]|nr:S9 family peptidase [Armatimonadota bacterium]